MDYNDFISRIVEDIGNPSYSYYYVSGWIFDPSNLGQLNILLDECFSVLPLTGESGTVTGRAFDPDMSDFEQAVYKKMFECYFYSRESKMSLNGSTSISGGWTSISEDDRTISRTNPNEIAKTFRGLRNDCQESLSKLINAYLRAKGGPVQVTGDDAVAETYYRGNSRQWDWRYRE